MAAVDEHGQLDEKGAAKVNQGIHRCPHGPSRVQHIVHQDDPFIPQGEGNFGLSDQRPGEPDGEVIPVKGEGTLTFSICSTFSRIRSAR